MRAVIDTCVVLDALCKREPFWEDACKILYLAADRHFGGFITAKSMTDIYYLVRKNFHDEPGTRTVMRKLLNVLYVLDTLAVDCRRALEADRPDFEDAVMIETALRSGVDAIVTRDMKGYAEAPLLIMTPADFLASGVWRDTL